MYDGTLDSVIVLNSKIVGVDSLFATSLSSVTFPLDYSVNEQSFEIVDIERTRIFDANYRVQSQFVSEECGPRFLLSNLEATSSSNDSVRVLLSRPGGSAAHVALYRCPRTNIVRVAFRQIVNEKVIRDTLDVSATDIDDLIDYQPVQFYKVVGKLSFINIPLDITQNTSQFTFRVGAEDKTMTFTYDRISKEIFEKCGTQTFITNLQLVSDIGSVESIVTRKYVSDSIYDPPKINFAVFQ